MKFKLLLASALALAVSSTAAAPFINPAALAVGNEGVLVSLPVRSSIHKPCHGAAGGLSEVSGLKAWLASALGRSRVSTKPARQHASSWTIIRLMSDVETQPTALNSVVPHVENVYGRPGYASVEDARRHRDLQLARPHHHRQATALGRFNEALEELSFAEGLFVSFVLGAGLGSLIGILLKIVRLLAFRRQARKSCGSSVDCGRQSRKSRRAARVDARAAALPVKDAGKVDEKAVLKEELAREMALPEYRDVEQVSADAAVA